MTATLQTTPAYQGRWGWHPCTMEEFQKLKEAHKVILKARKQTKRWLAWNAKLAHNRKGRPEPFNPATHISKNYYQNVLEEYQAARLPQPLSENAKPLKLPRSFWADVELLSKPNVSA